MDTMDQLVNLNKVPLDMTLAGLRSVQQGQQRDNIGLADLATKSQFTQQMNPLKLQEQELQNRNLGFAGDESLQNLHRLKRDNKEKDFTSDLRMQAEYKGMLNKASEEDLKTALYEAQRMMYSGNPKLKKQGEAIFALTKEHWDATQKHNMEMAKVDRQGANDLSLARENNAAGRYAKKGAGGGAKSIEDQVVAGKLNFEKAAAAYEILAAEMDDDDPRKPVYTAKAQQFEQAAYKLRQAGGLATPKIDTGAVAGMPTTGGAPPTSSLGKPAEAPKSYSLDQMKARYPGVPEEKLRAAAKAKGIELK